MDTFQWNATCLFRHRPHGDKVNREKTEAALWQRVDQGGAVSPRLDCFCDVHLHARFTRTLNESMKRLTEQSMTKIFDPNCFAFIYVNPETDISKPVLWIRDVAGATTL